jgi:hypothetical protein
VPPAIAVTTPDETSTVATDAFPELQVPPEVEFVSVVFAPWQSVAVPRIDNGNGETLTTVVTRHPPGAVYVIVDVPVLIPVTTPSGVVFAMVGCELENVPPVVAFVSVIERPTHNVDDPAIAAGSGLAVTIAVAAQPVPSV